SAPYRRTDAEAFVSAKAPRSWATGTGAPLGVFDLASGRLLGSHGLVSVNPVRNSAEIGYWTAPWARGRGVALTATRAVATWAFTQLRLDRLTWSAEIGNQASRLVALRAGFHIAGEQRNAQPHPRGRRQAGVGCRPPGEAPGQAPAPHPAGSRSVRTALVFA